VRGVISTNSVHLSHTAAVLNVTKRSQLIATTNVLQLTASETERSAVYDWCPMPRATLNRVFTDVCRSANGKTSEHTSKRRLLQSFLCEKCGAYVHSNMCDDFNFGIFAYS